MSRKKEAMQRDFENSIPRVDCPKCKTGMKHYVIMKVNYHHGRNSKPSKRVAGFRYKCSGCGLVIIRKTI